MDGRMLRRGAGLGGLALLVLFGLLAGCGAESAAGTAADGARPDALQTRDTGGGADTPAATDAPRAEIRADGAAATDVLAPGVDGESACDAVSACDVRSDASFDGGLAADVSPADAAPLDIDPCGGCLAGCRDTRDDCHAECAAHFNTCTGTCDTNHRTCTAACVGTPECVTACDDGQARCRGRCDDVRGPCDAACEAPYPECQRGCPCS